MKRSTRPARFPVLAATVALALAACGSLGEDSAEFEPEQEGQAEEPIEAAPEETEGEPEGQDKEPQRDDEEAGSGEGGSSGPLDPADAIETVTYDVPGEEDFSVTVGLHALRVEDQVMILELSFTPEFLGGETQDLYHMNGRSRPDIVLNDRENLKQYSVLTVDSRGALETNTMSGTGGPSVGSGETLSYWAYFAAPVDDIDTISVSVVPGLVEFENVEIQR